MVKIVNMVLVDHTLVTVAMARWFQRADSHGAAILAEQWDDFGMQYIYIIAVDSLHKPINVWLLYAIMCYYMLLYTLKICFSNSNAQKQNGL